MTVQIRVDLGAGVPPYEQIRSQVVAHVSAGHLRPGDRLPTVRDLAADLGVAVGTVARAYRELEGAGVVATRRRAGTVVSGGAPTAAPPGDVQEAATAFVARARAAGLTDEAVVDLVRGTLLARPPVPQPQG